MGRYTGKSCRLTFMLCLTTTYFLVEIVVGYMTNSMALVADSFHMLSDVLALIIGLFSVRISKKATSKNTFGWARAEVLGALVNAVFLLALCFSIFVEALKRIVNPERIEKEELLVSVGAVGLVINLVGLIILGSHGHSHGGHGHSHGGHGHSHNGHNHSHVDAHEKEKANKGVESLNSMSADHAPSEQLMRKNSVEAIINDNHVSVSNVVAESGTTSSSSSSSPKKHSPAQLNMKGVFLHVMGDALGSVIVIISATIMWQIPCDHNPCVKLEGKPVCEEKKHLCWTLYVDPFMSMLLVAIILTTTFPLLKESALILLQTVPTHIQVDKVKKQLIDKIAGVSAVHEFHVWQLTGNRIIASAHIQCKNLNEYHRVAEDVKEFFHNEGIHSTTIQPEFLERHSDIRSRDCILECVPEQCGPSTCCGNEKQQKGAVARVRHRGPSQEHSESVEVVTVSSVIM